MAEGWPEGSYGWESNLPERRDPAGAPIPIHKPGTPEYEHVVNTMADRIVNSYVASARNKMNEIEGERFYTHEAHGAATALAGGMNPDEGAGRVLRMTGNRPLRPYEAGEASSLYSGPTTAMHRHAAGEWQNAVSGPGHQERLQRAAGVLARLSPQTGWDKNVTQANAAYQMDPEGKTMQMVRANATGQGPRRAVIDASGATSALNDQTSDNIARAVDIAHGRAPVGEHVKTGPKERVKIGSFYENIVHPDTSPYTTVDFRHHDVAYGQLLDTGGAPRSNTAKVRSNMKNVSRYRMIEEATSRATDRINREHADLRMQPEPLLPHQIQAAVWWGDKRDVDRKFAEYPGAKRSEGSSNLYMVPRADDPSKMRRLGRSDLGRPIGQ